MAELTRVANVHDPEVLAALRRGDPRYVYIGRANRRYRLPESEWANPFKLRRESDRPRVLAQHREWLHRERPDLLARVRELRGRILCCYCAPLRRLLTCNDLPHVCHGQTLCGLTDWPAQRPQVGPPYASTPAIVALWRELFD